MGKGSAMEATHLNAGAQGRTRLVLCDEDRRDLVRRLSRAFGDRLLAWCVMDTHVHVVAETSDETGVSLLERALCGYIRSAAHRNPDAGRAVLRGPAQPAPKRDPFELARAIAYVHQNPVQSKKANVADPVEYVWSSRREFAGLSIVCAANVPQVRKSLGTHATWGCGPVIQLAGAEPSEFPDASLGTLLAAVAQVHRVCPAEIRNERRTPELVAARRDYVHLARLESYRRAQIAVAVSRTPKRVSQLFQEPVDIAALRMARTLVRDPALRRQLAPLQLVGSGS